MDRVSSVIQGVAMFQGSMNRVFLSLFAAIFTSDSTFFEERECV